MKRFIFFLIILSSNLLVAQQVITAPRVDVLYSDASYEAYAQKVANYTERALDVVSELFDYQLEGISVRLESHSDIYNGFANVYPHKVITLRPLFPLDTFDDPTASDQLYHVILHEMTHIVQLAYVLTPDSSDKQAPERSLFNPAIASIPPAWFLEGIAVWVESTYSDGGRNNDLLSQGLVRALLQGENPPSLSDIALMSYSRYPAGHARYLVGGAFVEYLIDQHGFDAVLALLQHYNARGIVGGIVTDFAAAWYYANGSSLYEEWDTWLAQIRSIPSTEEAGIVLDARGWFTGNIIASPDQQKLAWVAHPNKIMVTDISDLRDGELDDARVVIEQRAPTALHWQGNNHLLYTRTVINPHNRYSEILRLNVTTGEETRLTTGARAHHPIPLANGCILYNYDVAHQAAELRRWCSSNASHPTTSNSAHDTIERWNLPPNSHILSAASSPAGRVAISLWQHGQIDIIALELNPDGSIKRNYLTYDTAIDAEPFWQDEETLLFRSARGDDSAFQIYRLSGIKVARFLDSDLPEQEGRLEYAELLLERLSHSTYGATSPSSIGNSHLFYRRLADNGFQLVYEDMSPQQDSTKNMMLERNLQRNLRAAAPVLNAPAQRYPQQSYSPWASLNPFALLPSKLTINPYNLSQFELAAILLGRDITGSHNYQITLGYNSQLTGYLAGLYAYGLYSLQTTPSPGKTINYGGKFTFLIGLYPYAAHWQGAENVLGAGLLIDYIHPMTLAQQRWRLESHADTSFVSYASQSSPAFALRSSLALSNQSQDRWGYPQGMTFRFDGAYTPTNTGNYSMGLWLSASNYFSFYLLGLQGTAQWAARAGYRPNLSIPIPYNPQTPWLGELRLAYRYSQPLGWRYGDGLYGLERLTLQPQIYGWAGQNFGLGGAFTLGADMMIVYAAPVSLQATVGYNLGHGMWTRIGAGIPTF